MKIIKKLLWVLLGVLLIIQFFRPAPNVSAAVNDHDIMKAYPASPEVQAILQRACNDCHSNNTVYPWYSKIQPVAWWLDNHIKEGKRELNFSEFLGYRIARQYKKIGEVAEEVNEGDMPLSSYTLVHTNAKLSAGEKKQLNDWCDGVRAAIQAKYPADSLIMPKRKKA